MADSVLLELGVEEIPASFVGPALLDMARLFTEQCAAAGLPHGSIKTFGSPRRIALWASGVADKTPDVTREVTGPSVRAAFGPDGKPTQAATKFAQSLGVGPEGFLVLNAGRLTTQKDQATLLRAVGELPAAGRPVTCLVAGEGELRESLQSLIAAEGWGDRVRLLGFRDDVPALLQAADAFALPSLDEGMPMILLETAAAGTPIVATPVGDIPTLVRDGATGLVVARGDTAALAAALLRLRDEPGLGARLGAAARDEVRRVHSSETMAARYAEVYSQHVRQ